MVNRQSPLGEKHFLAFGAIVHHFAMFERLVEVCIAHILHAHYGAVAATISGLGYQAKCEALRSLVGMHKLPDGYAETMTKALDDFGEHNALRNAIAHHAWREGARPDTVKALSITSRGGKAKVRGLRDDERDYTADELIEIADELLEIEERFAAYLVEAGIMDKADFSTDVTSANS
jgi:hypothetical protein